MAEIGKSPKQSPDVIEKLLDEILQVIHDETAEPSLGRTRSLSGWVKSKGKETMTSLAKFFSCHQVEKTKRFYFRFTHLHDRATSVDLGVLFATESHAEKLHLNFTEENGNVAGNETDNPCYISLPSALNNESLISLRVTFSASQPYPVPHLHHVREMPFQRVNLPKHAINSITSNIPTLRQLTVFDCNRDRDLHIYIAPNPNFYKLTVLEHFSEVKHNSQVYIKGPMVRQINFLGCMSRAKYHIEDISDGFEVSLCFDKMFEVYREDAANIWFNDSKALKYENVLQELVTSFKHAKYLQLCNWCIQLFSLRALRHSERVTIDCTKLKIATSFRDLELPGITYMLKACPALAELILETAPMDDEIKIPQDSPIQCGSQEGSTFIFIYQELRDSLLNLRTVTFKVTTRDYQTWEDRNFDLSKFFNERRAGLRLIMLLRANTVNLERIIFETRENEFIYEDSGHKLGYHTLGY